MKQVHSAARTAVATEVSVPEIPKNVNLSRRLGAQVETDIAIDPTNPQHLIAGSNDYDGERVHARVYESTDGGLTWNSCLLPPAEAPFDAGSGDPTAGFDATGNAFFGCLHLSEKGKRTVGVSSKKAGAEIWETPTLIPNVNADKDLIAIDQTSGPFKGSVYLGWHNGESKGTNFIQDAMVARSSDGGKSFSPIKVNNTGTHVGGVVPSVGPDGEVYALWANWKEQRLYLNLSNDGGVTWGKTDRPVAQWSAQSKGSNFVKIPAAPRGIAIFPSMDIDRSDGPNRGTVYCAYVDGTVNLDVMLISSRDRGESWSTPVRVNDDGPGHDHFFPRVAVDDTSGEVHLAWYDTRGDAENIKTDVYSAASVDGGRTFQKNIKVTSAPTDETRTGSSDEGYGDYLGIASCDGKTHVIWTDGREGNSGEEVFSAMIE